MGRTSWCVDARVAIGGGRSSASSRPRFSGCGAGGGGCGGKVGFWVGVGGDFLEGQLAGH